MRPNLTLAIEKPAAELEAGEAMVRVIDIDGHPALKLRVWEQDGAWGAGMYALDGHELWVETRDSQIEAIGEACETAADVLEELAETLREEADELRESEARRLEEEEESMLDKEEDFYPPDWK
jgi:hypothetical protein